MKKIIWTGAVLLLGFSTWAQKDSTQGLDLLKSPSSPAGQLLGFAPNAIERPTDLPAFWLSIANASNDLTKLPSGYAVDFSPAALFGTGRPLLKNLQSRKTGDVMWQTLSVSLGFRSQEDSLTNTSFYRAGVGVKFSIVRPNWTSATHDKYKRMKALQKELTKAVLTVQERVEADTVYKRVFNDYLAARDTRPRDMDRVDLLDSIVGAVNDSLFNIFSAQDIINNKSNNTYEALRSSAREFTIERQGFFLDFAGGFAARFPTNEFGYSIADNAGAWLTGGYEGGNQKLSIYGIGRYLYQPETIFADSTGQIPTKRISTFDAGLRALYASKDDRFNFSFESIYRSVLNKSIVDPSWRLVFSAEYDLGFNQKISFNFGRDFNGVITKGGNLIAAINLIAGFGAKKLIAEK